jgi:hypothetical protein
MTKLPPLPPETRAKYKPYRAPRDRQDELFDGGGMKATRIRVVREDVVEDRVEDPVIKRTVIDKHTKEQKLEPTYNRAHRVQSRLERMKKRGEISEDEWKAGERYARDYEMSGGTAKSCLNFDIGGGDPELAMLWNSPDAASRRVARARQAMGIGSWPIVHWVAVEGRLPDEWVRERKLSTKTGVGAAMLRQGLRFLVDHYKGED